MKPPAPLAVKAHHAVYASFPTLRRYGLAVEYFPRYINRQTDALASIDVVLLSVIMRGSGRHIIDSEVHEVQGSTVGITNYGQAHNILTDARGMEIYNVYLDLRNHALPVLPERLRSTLSAILPIHPRLRHHLNRRVSIRVEDPAPLAASLRRIVQEMDSTRDGALEIVQHSFRIFLIDLCRAAQANGYEHSTPTVDFPLWAETLRQDLDRDFSQPQALGVLAARAGVHVAHLCRSFKAYTGRTVISYVVERRIQAAMWKLREGEEKVIAIALNCGFNDLAYFNRTFRHLVGTTPSAYRAAITRPITSEELPATSCKDGERREVGNMKKSTTQAAARKNPKGGLTAAGRKHFAETEGAHLKPGVTGATDTPEKMKRKGSFLRRHYANPRGPVEKDGQPTRLALAAHAWGEPVPKSTAAVKKLAAKGTNLLKKYAQSKPAGKKKAARKARPRSAA